MPDRHEHPKQKGIYGKRVCDACTSLIQGYVLKGLYKSKALLMCSWLSACVKGLTIPETRSILSIY